MTDDVRLNKVATIERCLVRVGEEFAGDESRLEQRTVEDAVVLNLQRACEAAIDLAMHEVALRRLGIPQESRDAFSMLEAAGILPVELADRMRRMVGFRNIAVHDYQQISRPILVAVVRDHLGDFESFCRAVLNAAR